MGVGRHQVRRAAAVSTGRALRATVLAVLLGAGFLPCWAGDTQEPAAEIPTPIGGDPTPALAPLQGHRGGEVYSLSFADEDIIEAFVQRLLASRLVWLQAVLDRSRTYRAVIAREIARRGMPRELQFLPALESGFQPRAVSPKGAAGMWQLMRNTAAPYGLRMDEWIDERRDVVRSTAAALGKLQEGYRQFGSWEMALAAYNAGAARMAGLVREHGTGSYWALRAKGVLPTETAAFVPQFAALSRILDQPGRHGLRVSWDPAMEWEQVAVPRTVDLRLLAEASGVDRDALAAGNPELLLGVTPPASYGYQLKVPAGHRVAVEKALAGDAIPLMEYRVHVVRKGDTLWAISRSYGVSLELLTESNPGVRAECLRVGSRLLVPRLERRG
jgi:membrane-bound lytic murein transglycosylase D